VFCEERYSDFATWFSFSVNKKQKKLQSLILYQLNIKKKNWQR